jgi:hypothetical protein
MVFQKLFRKKPDFSDFKKLKDGMSFLSKKVEDYFDDIDEQESLNPFELGIFLGAFNSACYLILRGNPSKSDLAKFTQHVVKNVIVDRLLDKEKISNAPDADIQDFTTTMSQHYSKRIDEYIDLIKIEAKKPKGSGAYVDITCGILKNLYEDKKPDEELYDPAFAVLLANHVSAFESILNR